MNYTICITNFRRPEHLRQCLESTRQCVNVVVATYGDDGGEAAKIVQEVRPGTRHFYTSEDFGCNALWQQAVALAETEWVVVLHDDDSLAPNFHRVVSEFEMPEDCGFLAWRGEQDWKGRTDKQVAQIPSLGKFFQSGKLPCAPWIKGCTSQTRGLAVSPVNLLLKKNLVLRTLSTCDRLIPDCVTRPGMMVGNDIALFLAHLRHSGHPNFYHLDLPLVRYGHWDGSETIKFIEGRNPQLVRQYDRARYKFRTQPVTSREPRPTVVHAVAMHPNPRLQLAAGTWQKFYERVTAEGRLVVPLHLGDMDFRRNSSVLGDPSPVPFLRDLLLRAAELCNRDDDLIVLSNDDTCFNPPAVAGRVLLHAKQHGAAVCHRRDFHKAHLGQIGLASLYRELTPAEIRRGRWHSGLDIAVFTRTWLNQNLGALPDFLIGREGWDFCLRRLIHQTTKNRHSFKNACYHEEHSAWWEKPENRLSNPGNLYNRKLTKEFLTPRGWYAGGFEPDKVEIPTDYAEPVGGLD